MKASELRIGNLVYDDFNEVHRVEGIKSTSSNEYDNCNGGSVVLSKIDSETGFFTCDVVSLIPLTEEWLMKLGFEKRIYDGDIEYSKNLIDISFKNGIYTLGGYELYLEIRSVHQLQNLYFALTGEELTIKETV